MADEADTSAGSPRVPGFPERGASEARRTGGSRAPDGQRIRFTGAIPRITGHLQVIERDGGRRYYALWRDAYGRHKKLLGPAWVRPAGRTGRGAPRWRTADGPKPTDEHLTPREAEAALAQLLAEAQLAAPRSPGLDVTFGQACHEWLRYVTDDRQRRASTVRDYRNMLRAELLPAFGADTRLAEITTEGIDAYREHRLHEGRIGRRTLQKNLVVLHAILKRAQRKGWIDRNPAADAERVTVKRSGDFNVLEPDQVQAAARAAEEEVDGVLILVAGFAGLRMGELLALRWRDVAFAHRSVFVRASWTKGTEGLPKSGKVRSVPLVDQALTALDGLTRRARFTGPDDLVFCNELGRRLTDDRVRAAFYRALEGAGLGHLRERQRPIIFHDLRHTFGTLAVQVFPLSDVQAFMGHADISTTMIYVHHVPRHDAADRLSEALRQTDANRLPAAHLTQPALHV